MGSCIWVRVRLREEVLLLQRGCGMVHPSGPLPWSGYVKKKKKVRRCLFFVKMLLLAQKNKKKNH